MNETTTTKPAPRQIWSVTGGNVQRTVTGVSGGFVRYTVGDYHHACPPAEFTATGKCIGIETDRGRVMAGERRTMVGQGRASGCVATIVRVIDDIGVEVEGRGHYTAATVATWPLLPSIAEAAKDTTRAPIAALSSESDYHAAAKRIAASTPVSYSDALRLVEYHGSEEAARIGIAATVAGGTAPHRAPAWSVTAQEVRGIGGRLLGKTRGTFSGECAIVDCKPTPLPSAISEPRPGTLSWVLFQVSYMSGVRTSDIRIEEDHKRAFVTVRVPSTVTKVAAERMAVRLREGMPLSVCVDVVPDAPPDPRTEREARRREIDAILREDARKHPAFATARKCAVAAMVENCDSGGGCNGEAAASLIGSLHRYESIRGGMREPSVAAKALTESAAAGLCISEAELSAYERSRGLP